MCTDGYTNVGGLTVVATIHTVDGYKRRGAETNDRDVDSQHCSWGERTALFACMIDAAK